MAFFMGENPALVHVACRSLPADVLRKIPFSLLLLSLAGAPGSAAHAAPSRAFPEDARKTTMTFASAGTVLVDDEPAALSPSAQIRNTYNRIVLPSHIRGEYKVRVKFDKHGQVHRVWILTPEEAAVPDPKR